MKHLFNQVTLIAAAILLALFLFSTNLLAGDSKSQGRRVPLGSTSYSSSSASPGIEIGYTYHDLQQVGSMGRMVEVGPYGAYGSLPSIVHFGCTYMTMIEYPTQYLYTAYNSDDGLLMFPFVPNEEELQGGYVNIDVSDDSRAIVGGHFKTLVDPVLYQSQMFIDLCPACAILDTYIRVPDALAAYQQVGTAEAMWPKFFVQYGSSGTDTVTHVLAQIKSDGDLQTLMYFRNDGLPGAWTPVPFVVDTVPCLSHDIAADRMGNRVALVWTANLNYQETGCDTCSGRSPYFDTHPELGPMDNDLYCQISPDQGITWGPKQNLTKFPRWKAAYKPYCDLSALMDSWGNLHIIYAACPWPADTSAGDGFFDEPFNPNLARLIHWSENVPSHRTFAVDIYDEPADSCGPPQWALRIAKPSLSECDGNLYAIWTQFNYPQEGIIDDCAQWGYDEDVYNGPANGEIWLSVSVDTGTTWDYQRNLTNSYTPHCLPGECDNDYWASMNRFGREIQPGLEDWTSAVIVDPDPYGSTTDYFLDIMYVNDKDAGSVIQDEGSWTENPIRWFRIPCVEEIPAPGFLPDWKEFDGSKRPVFCCLQFDTVLTIENIGNTALNYIITVEEDNGPPGWLRVTPSFRMLPSGLFNVGTDVVHLNDSGIIAEPGFYTGRLHYDGNDVNNLPADIEIELVVIEASCVLPGDINYDGNINGMDAVYLVAFLWGGGLRPPCLAHADVNCDSTVNGMDAVTFVNYLWNSGELCDPCAMEFWTSECCYLRGDFNHDGVVNYQDLLDWEAWYYGSGSPPFCLNDLDVDGNGVYTYDDLQHFRNFLLNGYPPLVPCP